MKLAITRRIQLVGAGDDEELGHTGDVPFRLRTVLPPQSTMFAVRFKSVGRRIIGAKGRFARTIRLALLLRLAIPREIAYYAGGWELGDRGWEIGNFKHCTFLETWHIGAELRLSPVSSLKSLVSGY